MEKDISAEIAVSLSPVELARAMQQGLEERRFCLSDRTFNDRFIPEPVRVDQRPRLMSLSDLLNYSLGASRHPIRWGLRVARRFFRRFLRPWLHAQTRFNQSAVQSIHQLHGHVLEHAQGVTARINELTDYLGNYAHPAIRSAHSRLHECFHLIHGQALALEQSSRQWNDRCAELFEQSAHIQRQQDATTGQVEQLAAIQSHHGAVIEEQRLLLDQQAEVIRQFEEMLRAAEETRAKDKAEILQTLENTVVTKVNQELSPQGTIAEEGLFFNPPIAVEYRSDTPKVSMITERIVEGIYVHNHLPPPPARVLDLGCAESINAIEMASLGYDVTGVDLRGLPIQHPNFRMIQADLCQLPFEDNRFDVVVSLSTIEHVGLKWYTEESDTNSDKKAILEAYRVLRPGGRLILTIPFGQSEFQTPVHRIYDKNALDRLLCRFQVKEMMFVVRDGEAWVLADVRRAMSTDSRSRVSAVALVVAEKE